MAAASVLAIVASLWAALDVYYTSGAATALTHNWRTYQGRVARDTALESGRADRAAGSGAVRRGGVRVRAEKLALQWLEAHGWPLHPAGFALAQSGALSGSGARC